MSFNRSWRRIPGWTKMVFFTGSYVGGSVLFKHYFAVPYFDEPVKLNGKVAIVTGANTGIGFSVAKELASRGAKVYLACRDKDRCAEARENIYLATDNKDIHCRYCDFRSLESVKRFARRIHKDETKVDILVNNAATMWGERELTEENFERHLGVNHLGPFLLTNLLVDLLKKGAPSRIVNVTCQSHERAKINVKDLNSAESYDDDKAYKQSKLANVLFTRELAKRLEGTNVTVNAVHPGISWTNLYRHAGYWYSCLISVGAVVFYPVWYSCDNAAQNIVHVALHPELENTTGQYFKLQEAAKPSKEALNDQLALWLWLTSEKWTKLAEASKELNISPLPSSVPVGAISIPNPKQQSNVIADDASNQKVGFLPSSTLAS